MAADARVSPPAAASHQLGRERAPAQTAHGAPRPPQRRRSHMALRALALLSLALRLPCPLGRAVAAAPRTCGSPAAPPHCAPTHPLVCRLRGGGRRRKDWQSPRPGDSDEVYSTSDPEWSVARDSSAVQRASSEDASDASELSSEQAWSSSDSERPRRRAERRPHSRGRTRHESRHSGRRARAAPTKSRSRVPARRRAPSPSEASDDSELGVSSDAHAPARRPRRAAAADPGLRWGTQATDALDAALRGKLVTAKPRSARAKAEAQKTTAARRRQRREMAETSDESEAESAPSEPTTFLKGRRAGSSHRAGRARDQPAHAFLQQPPTDADSWDGEARYANTAVFPALSAPSVSVVHHSSSSASDAAPALKGSPVLAWPSFRSPQQHVPSPRPGIPVQEAVAAKRASPGQSPGRDEDVSEGCSLDSRSESVANECAGDAVAIDGEDAVEEVLRGLTDRVSCEGDAVFLTLGASRVWRGVAVSADGVRRIATKKTLSPHAMRSDQSQEPLVEERPDSPFVVPVSTDSVLRGLGAVMSQAADALASAGQRDDLECAGLSDNLMGLAQRLDAARKEGESVSALLHAPQTVLGEHAAAADSAMQSEAGKIEEELRCWRRRTIVSGVWHEMQRQSAVVARREKLQSARGCMHGQEAAAGAGKIVYVGGNHGMSDEEVQKMMSNFGRVVRVHSSDAYAFVEVRPTHMCHSAYCMHSLCRQRAVAVTPGLLRSAA